MEQPPGSLDDLPHQSVSSSTVPSVIDLTRKEEECLLTSSSLDPLRRVKGSGWALSSSSTIPALQFSDTGSSDVTLRSGDQIQPDNALSHTTVTLSYVSRSHVFSTHSSPLYSVSPLSRFSLHPFEETSYALNQHYEEPVNLVTQAEPFPSFTQPQVGPEGDAREYDAREPPECNGRVLSSDGYEEETDSSILPDSRGCLENGGHDGWSNSMAPSVSPPEILRDEERGTSEALFTKAKKLDQVLSNSRGATDVCSVNREYKSPLEDPISPPSTPVDNVEDVFLLPQASSSPSADGCYLEAADDAARDTLSTDGTTLASSVVGPEGLESCDESTWSSHGPKAPLELSSDGPKAPLELSSDGSKAPLELSSNGPEASLELSSHGPKASLELSSHGPKASFELPSNGPEASLELLSHGPKASLELSSDGPKASLELSSDGPKAPLELSSHGPKALLEASINSAKVACVSDDLENKTSCVPRINGNANVLERAIKERKLPMRSGRGTRLEAIVMNINSNRYKVSGCILTNKKPSASQPTAPDSAFPRSRRKSKAMSTFSAKTVRRKAVKRTKGEPRNVDAQSYNESTSVSELDKTETSGGGTPAKRPRAVRPSRKPVRPPRSNPVKSKRKPSSQPRVRRNSNTKPESVSVPKPSAESDASKVLPLRSTSKSAKNNQGGRQSKSPTKKTKASCTPKRRRKKPKRSQPSSMFSLKEPEIKLKYVNFKEEKRELRSDGFSPFVHVNRQHASSALCRIINYPEEAKTEPRRQHAHSRRFVSAVVPSTSCLQLGRSSTHGSLQRAFVCCLCGQSANSMDLGDLHGPYYPEGYRPDTKAPAHVSGLKEDEEDSSDSDSSCSNVRARRRAPLKQKGLLGSRKWVSSRIRSPAGKQARLDGSLADGEDWYSPPVLPGDPCEYWLHEDCGIWSAGIFLVKGKVYGLEEAVKVAQETTCSACRRPGATLGCFFKVCPNKYHYRCALESDCVLVEENFSLKCKKHKNKTLTAPPGSRRDDR